MIRAESSDFLAGVIEGFYGPPWARAERLQLFDWMAEWGLNTYFYCPKDDWKNRAIWRESYSAEEQEALAELIRACQARGLHFLYGLSPGLDIRYSSEGDAEALRRRLEQMLGIGCGHFALLFDDIPDRLDASDVSRFGSLASAQCAVTRGLFEWTRERQPSARFLFCPTPYCSRMVASGLGGEGYLETVGRELPEGIDVLWTGPEIISKEIPVTHIEALSGVLRRKPVIWDNLHANDYDGRRFFCGPYSGRPAGLKAVVKGILTNPNTEFSLNEMALRTFAGYVGSPETWEPREGYLAAMRAWHAQFATCGAPVSVEDLILLGDCYYLPYEEGPEAEALFAQVRDLLGRHPSTWGEGASTVRRQVVRLRDICARMPELRDRALFHALSRRVWELREEMDLLDRYLGIRSGNPGPEALCGSDFHRPGTYRGGLVARLQRLLVQKPNGDFVPASPLP